jgi:gliding motility-associated-like protein
MMLTLVWLIQVQAHEHDVQHGTLKFQENLGQWPDHVDFGAKLPNAMIFLEGQTITFNLDDPSETELFSLYKHHQIDSLPSAYHSHAFRIHLRNSQTPTSIQANDSYSDWINYYYGNDPANWQTGVRQYGSITYEDIYPGIDLRFYSLDQNFKYEFIVEPGIDPSIISMEYEGLDDIKLGVENLLLETSVQSLVDQKPVSWELNEDQKTFISSGFSLDSNTVSFQLESYDSSQTLVIDPTLIFSTYSGSTVNNWGSTATYDSLGNMYAGGYVVVTGSGSGGGYPTSSGAYQTTFSGGSGTFKTDMTISKFNASGTNIIYSTYIGGNGNEIPHSLVVNDNNQLYVLGTTSSSNFPTSSGAFDGTFNGGSTINGGTTGNTNSSQIQYANGSDIIVSKFNASGTALLASTYIGGSGNDGINLSDTLQKAYADEFRGEIIVDGNDNCYVATTSASSNFPIVNGFQASYGGGLTDGIVFKFNSSLTSLLWSTFIGGDDADAAYSVQFDPNFDVFVTGGTISTDFPTSTGALHTSFQGGSTDGWVSKISNNGQSLLASTYLGTNSYDQSFFVQLDLSGDVYVVGQTLGNYPIGPNWVYSVANSGQFLHKLNNSLSSTVFSTRWGSGNSAINLSMTAFLVNECNHIFVSGWGGNLFGIGAPTSSGGTTTNGLPTTNNAVQTTTDGQDFYFIVFEDSAKSILFASFFGGNTTSGFGGEHVDGGTSRFDKKGIIYQAACASCGTGSTFPTTSGSYSTTKGTGASCNMAAMKYDLITLEAEADVDGPLTFCIDDSIQFQNESFGGSQYLWDFGDGNNSDEFEPKHAYSVAGVYEVVLIIYDSVSCIFSDTDSIQVTILPGPEAIVPSYPRFCPGEQVQLTASGGDTYQWGPSTGLNDPTLQNPIAIVGQNQITYTVSVSDSCGTDTAQVTLRVHPDNTDAIDDTALCDGLSGKLWATGGSSYSWSPTFYLNNPSFANPTVAPDSTVHYTVTIVDSFNCVRTHEVTVFVEGFVPQVEAWGDTTICSGDRVMLRAKGTNGYEWFPKTGILDPFFNNTPAYPTQSTTYVVVTFNSCGEASDSVVITIDPISIEVNSDSSLCEGDTAYLKADGALVYQWSGPGIDGISYSRNPSVIPNESGWFKVEAKNITGCSAFDSLFLTVNRRPKLDILTNEDTITGLENVLLIASSDHVTRWSSSGFIPCEFCDSIVVYPAIRTQYFVQAIDSFGCHKFDSIVVAPISKIFVPNSFTPDGDGINDIHYVRGHNISNYEISIRNRWGNEVYKSNDINIGWDGTKFNDGKKAQIDVYTYVIKYTVKPDEELFQVGEISLIR